MLAKVGFPLPHSTELKRHCWEQAVPYPKLLHYYVKCWFFRLRLPVSDTILQAAFDCILKMEDGSISELIQERPALFMQHRLIINLLLGIEWVLFTNVLGNWDTWAYWYTQEKNISENSVVTPKRWEAPAPSSGLHEEMESQCCSGEDPLVCYWPPICCASRGHRQKTWLPRVLWSALAPGLDVANSNCCCLSPVHLCVLAVRPSALFVCTGLLPFTAAGLCSSDPAVRLHISSPSASKTPLYVD